MFTGLVEATGVVESFDETGAVRRLRLGKVPFAAELSTGDSVAVNGCCLTVVEQRGPEVGFDLLAETVALTSFASLAEGDLVNLERSLRADGRLGGHVVSGHVDTCVAATTFEARGKDHYLRVDVPPEFQPYLVSKGSIAVDGVSLTLAEVDEGGFGIWLIPHTVQVTRFSAFRTGDLVNLEFDMMAKLIARQVEHYLKQNKG